jgi:hypothetical protein
MVKKVWSFLKTLFSNYIQNATAFGSNKKSSDAPETDNQWINGRVFFCADFLSVWAVASPPPPPPPNRLLHFLQYLYPPCAEANTCLPCLFYIWIMFWIKVALDMEPTLWTPNFQVSLEKVHKTGKQVIFWENTGRDLERKLPRGGIAYFWNFQHLKVFGLICPWNKGGPIGLPP